MRTIARVLRSLEVRVENPEVNVEIMRSASTIAGKRREAKELRHNRTFT